uniref:Golgi to ER traffic protein 4 n=1 Tax=Globisporangium ultimum (strain ATCC 200006 / CBS 805.95 / DAOM BR144) TaxID=431595 RepID=K3WSS6_GLOUD
MSMNRRALARQAAGAKSAAATAPPQDNSGVENVTRKLEAQLAAGDFYGALQMYKTLFMRFLKGEPDAAQQEKAIELALEASLCLVKHEQNTAATEMANLMVSVYSDFHFGVDETTKDRIRKINAAFVEKPQFSADLAVFLKNAVKWSSVEGSRKRGDPELQLLLARAYRKAGDFTHAAKHYLHAENPSEFADALFEWSTHGYQSEYDLYLARVVLQLLSLENLRDANTLRDAYVAKCKDAKRPVDLPLFNFVRFLLLTLERDALSLFQVLQERYAAALSRDASLKSYLSVIGQKFYGLQPPRNGLSSLLEMFSGGM